MRTICVPPRPAVPDGRLVAERGGDPTLFGAAEICALLAGLEEGSLTDSQLSADNISSNGKARLRCLIVARLPARWN